MKISTSSVQPPVFFTVPPSSNQTSYQVSLPSCKPCLSLLLISFCHKTLISMQSTSSPLFITLVHTCHPTQGICVDGSTVHENHTFRLTSNATHLGIQRPLQLQHVGVLLGVDVVIGKIHQQTLNVEPARKQQRC